MARSATSSAPTLRHIRSGSTKSPSSAISFAEIGRTAEKPTHRDAVASSISDCLQTCTLPLSRERGRRRARVPGFWNGRRAIVIGFSGERQRETRACRPTGKRFEGWTWRLLGHESGSAGMLAGRHESGDRRAPLRPHRPHHRHTRVHAKAQLRAERQPRPETRQRGESRDWRRAGPAISFGISPALLSSRDFWCGVE